MVRIAINGFGRIGRVFTRAILDSEEIELVAINDLTDAKTLAHLLKYDSVHGHFPAEVSAEGDNIIIDGKTIPVLSERSPDKLPWGELEIDIVVESTGIFRTKDLAELHVKAGAKKVVISAPSKGGDVKMIVMGINDDIIEGSETVVSNASCTTNCAAPMIQIIDELCGIESGYITTVHSYTSDQRLHDAPHSDLRRARAAAQSIVPTSTGAAEAITKIFPHLDGCLGGIGIRVPVPDGSVTDIVCTVKNPVSASELNDAFRKASEGKLNGIMEYTEDPIVSIDIVGDPASVIVDSELTTVIGNMIKVVGWYDNEVGYSNRLVDLVVKLGDYL